jgi:hypothetical protein
VPKIAAYQIEHAPYILELRTRCRDAETIGFVSGCLSIVKKTWLDRLKEGMCSRLKF